MMLLDLSPCILDFENGTIETSLEYILCYSISLFKSEKIEKDSYRLIQINKSS